jgi:hypothetical protein
MIGGILQWLINTWLYLTGKKMSLVKESWLNGPIGSSKTIGDTYYKEFAMLEDLSYTKSANGGLLKDFNLVLNPKDENYAKLNKRVKDFYENTSKYKLEVWSEWYGIMSIFAKILIRTASKRMNQLNIPLSPLATSKGMSSEIIELQDKQTGLTKYTCWLRKLTKTNEVVYAGFYTSCLTPALEYQCVKVVFPMPKGNVTVILRVEIQTDGSVKLISDGRYKNGPGYYRMQSVNKEFRKIKKIPLQESIHVYEDEDGTLRTDHLFYFFKIKLLHLHYKIIDPKI